MGNLKPHLVRIIAAILLVSGLAVPSRAQIVPYDPSLNDLAETLGSIHYLTNLCADEKSNRWRDEMSDLLATERPDPVRRSRLVASFNRGYRSFASVYVSCTDQARLAADQFLARGAALAVEIENRFVQ
ncbi:MAG: TIGR02301 family protein [Pseudomonadota bacterium]